MAHNSGKHANQSWGGRFASAPADLVADFTDSQHYDRQLYQEDIRASKAHAAMLGRQGIISQEEADKLIAGLDVVLHEIDAHLFEWKKELEDVHMNIEARLTELVGDTGKKLHTGRSRNDQVGLTFHMYVAKCCWQWRDASIELCRTLYDLARDNQQIILPGFTHLQPGQPVLLSQHLLAYTGMFRRDAQRLEDAAKRIRISPLGAAALAGSTYPLDPESVASEVGFNQIYANSMDAVSDRDYVLEALFIASVIMMHLSRLCEELILWANPAFGYIRLPDEFATGSSIMPQKRNPDVAELVRGKTGRVYGSLMGLLTTMKGLPLAYNRDMQEDKEGFFDTSATVLSCLTVMAAMLKKLVFNADRMRQACCAGFLNATEMADYLVGKGVPFREAHHFTGQMVALAEKLDLGLEDLALEQMRSICPLVDKDVYPLLTFDSCVKRRETPGGTGPESVRCQLEDLRQWLDINTTAKK